MSAIHAIPKRAIIATIPERKIVIVGTSVALTLQRSRINAAAASMTIWMIGVTESGSVPPSSEAMVGRMSSKRPKMQMIATAPRKIATLRFA